MPVDPKAAAGALLPLIRTGELIELDAVTYRLQLDVADRTPAWVPSREFERRYYYRLYRDHGTQAGRGIDTDLWESH